MTSPDATVGGGSEGDGVEGRVEVTVDEGACCSSGMCTVRADRVFDQREEDGVVVVLDSSPPPELFEAVREAAAVCPTGAIRLAPVRAE